MIDDGRLIAAARLSLLLVVGLTFQFAVAARMEVFGVQGDLMLLIAICAGLATGAERGARLGFLTGLSFDLLLQSPFGLSALTYALVAFVAGSLQDSVLRATWWIPVATAAAMSALGVILYGVFGTMVGEDLLSTDLLRVALVVSGLNAIAAPIVLRAVRWAVGGGAGARARAVLR